jgi:rhamnosyl/mannosyltransferase
MHIVHIYKDYFPVLGGIENHVRDLAVAQAAAGHRVTVLVTQRTGLAAEDRRIDGVRVVKARRQLNVQSAPIAVSFPAHVQRLTAGADIVHLHAPYPIGEAANLYFGRARRSVITWHSDIVRQKILLRLYTPLLRRVLQKADRVLPTSEAYARTSPWLAPHLGKCVAVPLGIDAARFVRTATRTEQAAELRKTWQAQVPGINLVVMNIGRLRYYKGLDDLIRALPRLPGVLAVFVGNGPMEAEWKALADAQGVADRVLFPGSPDDAALPTWLQAADVYALPANSRAEAFGIAVLEAMASSLPVITTDVGSGTSWINQHEATGVVCPPQDPAALAAAITRLHAPELRTRFGEAARARVEAEFTREKMLARVLAVYDTLLRS